MLKRNFLIINESILNIGKERLVTWCNWIPLYIKDYSTFFERSWTRPECCVKKINFLFSLCILRALYLMSNIQNMSLEDIMGERFGRYSKYIIQERALPDIRDGLKPVQRRILYSMNKDGNTHDKGYRKSAKSVGNIMGNFHPHGDSSIYDAMVRMSQDWKNREILVEMPGTLTIQKKSQRFCLPLFQISWSMGQQGFRLVTRLIFHHITLLKSLMPWSIWSTIHLPR